GQVHCLHFPLVPRSSEIRMNVVNSILDVKISEHFTQQILNIGNPNLSIRSLIHRDSFNSPLSPQTPMCVGCGFDCSNILRMLMNASCVSSSTKRSTTRSVSHLSPRARWRSTSLYFKLMEVIA